MSENINSQIEKLAQTNSSEDGNNSLRYEALLSRPPELLSGGVWRFDYGKRGSVFVYPDHSRAEVVWNGAARDEKIINADGSVQKSHYDLGNVLRQRSWYDKGGYKQVEANYNYKGVLTEQKWLDNAGKTVALSKYDGAGSLTECQRFDRLGNRASTTWYVKGEITGHRDYRPVSERDVSDKAENKFGTNGGAPVTPIQTSPLKALAKSENLIQQHKKSDSEAKELEAKRDSGKLTKIDKLGNQSATEVILPFKGLEANESTKPRDIQFYRQLLEENGDLYLPKDHITNHDLALIAELAQEKTIRKVVLPSSCDASSVTRAGCANLAKLKDLKELFLINSSVKDHWAVPLKKLEGLERLYLDDSKVSDLSLLFIRDLEKLKDLSLKNTTVSDSGLIFLNRMRNLELLSLAGTSVTGEGFQHFKNLNKLYMLELSGTRVSDQGLSFISQLPNIRVLDLSDTAINDIDALYLAEMNRLYDLKLRSTAITDNALPALAKLKNLSYLELQNTKITGAGIDKFKLQSLAGNKLEISIE